ncbi:MAG: rod shape-determining protein RodA [Lewinella sp.]|nr:rod shape-determining protein RodA [Lewinella sp.]
MSETRQTLLVNIDYLTFCLYLALVGIGGLFIYSVDVQQSGAPSGLADFLSSMAGKQVIWIIISLFVFSFIVLVLDAKFWQTFAYLVYGFGIALLILVLFLGTNIKGATSWFTFGGFSFQPSEVAKFGTCLAMAAYLSHWSTKLREWRTAAQAAALFVAPAGLILLQPDAGSALVFLSFLIAMFREGLSPMLYVVAILSAATLILGILYPPVTMIVVLAWIGGLVYVSYQRKHRLWWLLGALMVGAFCWVGIAFEYDYYALGGILLVFALLSLWQLREGRTQLIPVLTVGLLWTSALATGSNYAFNEILQPHQQQRINVWLQPDEAREENRDATFNLDQSRLAISGGGITGQGLLSGPMTRGRKVPEQSTDFIFCTIGEEQGFVGSAAVVALFLLLLLRITIIAERQTNAFSRVYAYGVAGIIFVHVFVNIGMTMGLMPIIGIPLPFISKGGSSLLGFTIMLAVLIKLDKHRGRIKVRRLL